MPSISGSFSGKITKQSGISLNDQANHELAIAEVNGTQSSSDPLWNDSRITYWGINDLLDGEGTQNGYFNNIHPDGGRDFGTFEGKVNATDGSMTVEGSFKFTGGDGKYSDITGAEPLRPLQNQKPRSKPPGQVHTTGESTVSLTPRIERSYNFKLIVLSWENVSSTRRGFC